MKPKELFLVMETSCSDEFADSNANLIVIPLTKEYVQSLLTKIDQAKKLKAQDDLFYSLEYFDYHAQYYDNSDDRFTDLQDIEGHHVMDDILSKPGSFALVSQLPVTDDDRTILDVPTVIVRPDGIEYQGAMKNTNVYVNSPNISVETLREIEGLLE